MAKGSDELFELLSYMDSNDVSKMDHAELIAFKAICFDKFISSSAFFNCVLSDVAQSNFDNYLSFVSPPENDFCVEKIGTFGIFISKDLDRFIGEPPLIQKAASIFHPIKIEISLFAESHFTGYSHKPYIVISIQCVDDPALKLFEKAAEVLGPVLNHASSKASRSNVISCEGAMVSIENPYSMVVAIKEGASLVRKHAINSNEQLIEGLSIEFSVNDECTGEAMLEIVQTVILGFNFVASCLIQESK